MPESSKGFILGVHLPLCPRIIEMYELLHQEWISMERDGEAPQIICRHKFLDWEYGCCTLLISYIRVVADKDPSRVLDVLGYLYSPYDQLSLRSQP